MQCFFHSRDERDSHIDRFQRAFINVKFKDDVIRTITRNSDGLLECGYGHTNARARAVAHHFNACNESSPMTELSQEYELEQVFSYIHIIS